VSVNGTLVGDMRRLKSECVHFSFNKCPIDTHDSTSAELSINSQTDNSVGYKNSHFLSALLSGKFYCYLFTYTYKGDSYIPAPGEGLTLTEEPREHCCVTRSHVNVQMLS
jgi:hypothetical protein